MDYNIAHFPRENERALFKTDGETALWLQPNNSRLPNKSSARRFLHEDSAVWCLLTIRMCWEPAPYIQSTVEEKKTWGELVG